MKKLLIIFTALLSYQSIAQDGPKVVVFNSSENEKREPAYWSKYNLVKFNLLEAFSGDFAFYYERILHENFSAEIGLGVTLSDYVSMFLDDNFTIDDDNYEPLLGYSISLGGRYYPMHAADEFYVAPEFKYKFYHNNIFYQDLTGDELSMEESKSMAIGRLTFGYMYFFDDNIFIDFSGGFGIGKIKQTRLAWEVDDLGFQQAVAENNSTLGARFHLGIKVGVAF